MAGEAQLPRPIELGAVEDAEAPGALAVRLLPRPNGLADVRPEDGALGGG